MEDDAVAGDYQRRQPPALLDSGSTHNFIDLEAAQHAGVQWQPSTELHVAVANGDCLTSPGCYRGLYITMGAESFTINCYSLEIASYEMVLGVQWLESAGAQWPSCGMATRCSGW
jgi:hypothetical protein